MKQFGAALDTICGTVTIFFKKKNWKSEIVMKHDFLILKSSSKRQFTHFHNFFKIYSFSYFVKNCSILIKEKAANLVIGQDSES